METELLDAEESFTGIQNTYQKKKKQASELWNLKEMGCTIKPNQNT